MSKEIYNNQDESKEIYNDEDEYTTSQNDKKILVDLTNNIYNPYNPNNIEITEKDIKDILLTYGLPPIVNNIELYERAFIHRSYLKISKEKKDLNFTIAECPKGCCELKSKCNERLEFLGDGILEAVTKIYIYFRFPKENEGFMTNKKIAIVNNESIGKICYEMGLQKWLIVSKGTEEKLIRKDFKKLGCLFEAFIGAVYLDFNKIEINTYEEWNMDFNSMQNIMGFSMASVFLHNVFAKHIDWTDLINKNDNYKNIFQEKLQKEFKLTPHYLEISIVSSTTFNNSDNMSLTISQCNYSTTLDSIRHLLKDDKLTFTDEIKYTMGVFLCLGQNIQNMKIEQAIHISDVGNTIQDLITYTQQNSKVFICFGIGQNKLKKKAEQYACKKALLNLNCL